MTAASLGVTSNAYGYLVRIVREVQRLGLPKAAAYIAVETAITESGLQMYANAYNPESLQLPHDAIGYDHGSVGLFQQQVGGAVNSTANWGTTAQLMNVEVSAQKFLAELVAFDYRSMTRWDAAQRVQGSFDPTGGNYKRNDDRAVQLVDAVWGDSTETNDAKPVQPGRKTYMFEVIRVIDGASKGACYRLDSTGRLTHLETVPELKAQLASPLCAQHGGLPRDLTRAEYNSLKSAAQRANV